jgi:heterodisulfide reductase subunit C2
LLRKLRKKQKSWDLSISNMKIVGQKKIKTDPSFTEEVTKRSSQNIFLCYQCKKCVAGCPAKKFMDSTPAQLMRYIQLGMADEAMKQNIVWSCVSCQSCSARCPQEIDVAGIVDAVRIMVQQKNIKADTKNIRLFNRLWMEILKYAGRIYEIGLIGALNTLTGKPFKDLALGFKMFRKGKLRIVPAIKRPLVTIKIFKRAGKLSK